MKPKSKRELYRQELFQLKLQLTTNVLTKEQNEELLKQYQEMILKYKEEMRRIEDEKYQRR